ncbi:helix-turn-helix domain-containing protein [Streptomyces sp. S3(2020)]|uniref:IclR family transcriptional regulator n=1 Tax=Streptomyces sp. S3(2020) TaxID=2732044 RepID=UPI001487F648|nr:helix-turn-helix domain-containing protein [Streptomyces sp. S3(2020)]NNN30647.1 helix-turn-helix domain-containing protein [Streptomyces sp. S3(2020)]
MSGSAQSATREGDSGATEAAKRPSQPAAQTLIRGLAVLRAVAQRPQGLTATEIATQTGLHRTVVHRLVNTLMTEGFVSKDAAGYYRPGRELHSLANMSQPTLVEFVQPHLQRLADEHGGTAVVFVAEHDSVVAVATAVPAEGDYHLAYRKGSRQPLDRGAAPCAIQAGRPATAEDSEAVREARRRGWAVSHGAVEPGAHAVAAPLARDGDVVDACVTFISHRRDRVEDATRDVLTVAEATRAFCLGAR